MIQANEPSLPNVTWMKVKEVAAYLRISKMTVIRRIHEGTLPATRIGREFRIDQRDIEQLVKEGKLS
jgi:excisionase family DNA binding protein